MTPTTSLLDFDFKFDEFHPSSLAKYKITPSPMILGKRVTEPKEGTKLFEAIKALEEGDFQKTIEICGKILSIFEDRVKYSSEEIHDAYLIENSAGYYKHILNNSIFYLACGYFQKALLILSRLVYTFPKSEKIFQLKYTAFTYEQTLRLAYYAYYVMNDPKVAAQKAKEILDKNPDNLEAREIYSRCYTASMVMDLTKS